MARVTRTPAYELPRTCVRTAYNLRNKVRTDSVNPKLRKKSKQLKTLRGCPRMPTLTPIRFA